MPQRQFHITAPRRQRIDEVWRVSAKVEGEPLWFECNHARLAARPEAFLTTFFIPALHASARLTIDAEVDPKWIEQTQRLLPIYHRWWGYGLEHPVVRTPRAASSPDMPSHPDRTTKAQCFTGGIDSFYALLCGSHEPAYLLYVHGFDIPIEDRRRFGDMEQSLYDVAEATRCSPIIVRTNMREHPIFRAVSWERTHGAALAAIGLLLENEIASLVIPSSYTYDDETPWGSHWDTDPLWASPDVLDIVHDDASISRRDKIFELADEPLAQRHLRVCWRNLAPTGNCSRCEKCLRTMTTLEASGHLPAYHRVFDTHTPLDQLLDDLRRISPHLIFVWEDLATRNVSPPTRAAIQRLLRRSEWAARLSPMLRAYGSTKSLLARARNTITGLFRAPYEP